MTKVTGARAIREATIREANRRKTTSRADKVVALTRDSIVATALELSEREGPAALTLRRLGIALAVDATAFYRHFRDKDEIVLACMDRIIEMSYDDIETAIEGADWRTVVTEVAWASWRMCEAHPAIYSLAFARTTGGPGERRMVELLVGRLYDIGLSPAQTVLMYRLFVDSMLSMCGMQAAMLCLPDELAKKDATAWSRIYAVLPQEHYPATRRHAEELSNVSERDLYGALVDALINTIAAAAKAKK